MGSSWSIVALVLASVLAVMFFSTGSSAAGGKDEEAAGRAFLAEKETEAGVYKLPSGMLVKVLTKGTGTKSPNLGDQCEVHYEGTLRDGTVFDSSYRRGSPLSFAPNQVIKGWTEALQLMREGDKWEVFIPYELAYGTRGAGGQIPGYAALVFKMELLKVKAAGKSEADVNQAIEKAFGKSYAEL
jgi:FKBP-type peptidyl-prolyl cis-trans isomerase FklB